LDLLEQAKSFINNHCKAQGLFDQIGDYLIIGAYTLFNAFMQTTWTMRFSIVLQSLLACQFVSPTGVLKRFAVIITELVSRMYNQVKPFEEDPLWKPVLEDPKYEPNATSDDVFDLLKGFWELTYLTLSEGAGKEPEYQPQSNVHYSTLRDFAKTFNDITSVIKGVEYVGKLFYHAVQWSYLQVYKVPFSWGPHSVLVEKCEEWMKEAQALEQGIGLQKGENLTTSYAQCIKIKTWKIYGEELSRELMKSGWTLSSYGPFFSALREFDKLHVKAKSAMRAAKSRLAPPCVGIDGLPKAGKSVCIQKIGYLAYQAICRFERLAGIAQREYTTDADLIYPRKYEQKYWTGYEGQLILLYDDFLQCTDPEIATQIAMEIIHACNTAPYPVNKAEASEKLDCFLSSRNLLLINNAS